MDLAVRTETYGPDSTQGYIVKPSDITEVGCTLDLANTTATDGYVIAGTPLGGPTAAGLFGDYDPTATTPDGREVFAGLLYDTIPTRNKTTGNVGASRVVVGAVYEAKLPIPLASVDAKSTLPIAFV